MVCAASDDLVRAINSREDVELILLIGIGLKSVYETGFGNRTLCGQLRMLVAFEDLRRRRFARNVKYPANLFSGESVSDDSGAAQFDVTSEIPCDLTERASG